MNKQFDGIYFDGHSINANKVRVSITTQGLTITLEATQEKVLWKHHEINSLVGDGNKYVLEHAGKPVQVLEVIHADFLTNLRQIAPQAAYIKSAKISSTSKILVFVGIVIAALIALLVGIYFVIIPLAIDKTVQWFPKQQEIEMGKTMLKTSLATEKVNIQATHYINEFCKQLNTSTVYPIHVTVVDSKVENAYALPGGEIVVFSEIIKNMKSKEALVALLGHEIGHIHHQHTLKLIMKQSSNYILISMLLSDFTAIGTLAAEQASQLDQLAYGRNAEDQSDEFGLKLMVNNGIDPKGELLLLEQLQQHDAAGELPQFVMTHPKLENRLATAKERIAKLNY